jgi:glycerate kinase
MPRRRVVVIAPDSFKGSVSASVAAQAIGRGLARVWPDVLARQCPMADGGEGTLDAILSCGGRRCSYEVSSAAGLPISAPYGLIDDGTTAVIEAAQVVGLTDAIGTAVGVEQRSTQGIGELIRAALDAGVRSIMVGVGGSSTNDGGAGMLVALGLQLHDAAGRAIAPTPEGLASLAHVDAHTLDTRLSDATITIMSDVNNPLTGARGATAIFGPQKGVARARVDELDARLKHFATLVEGAIGSSAKDAPGSGAAGGLGFALQLIGGKMRSGAEVIADLVGLDAALSGADWLITGEGRSDTQTLLGKTPLVVARRAHAKRVPATLISGSVDPAALSELGRHFAGCFALPSGPATLEQAIADAETLLADRAEQAARLWSAAQSAIAK